MKHQYVIHRFIQSLESFTSSLVILLQFGVMNFLDLGNSIPLTASEEAFQNYIHLFYFLIVERDLFASRLVDDEVSECSISSLFIPSACLQGFLNTCESSW